MIGKLILAGFATVALTSVSAEAARAYGYNFSPGSSAEITISNDDTNVVNFALAEANTGNNEQRIVGSRDCCWVRPSLAPTMQLTETGDAGVDALSDAIVNQSYMEVASPLSRYGQTRLSATVVNDDTSLNNGAQAAAKTGANQQKIFASRQGGIQTTRTGDATAMVTALAKVNLSDLRISR